MENRKNIVYINVDKIYPHPDNPRKELGDLTELADSIKAAGIFQNLTVVPKTEDTYTVIIGHRRLEASKKAGLTEVPCVIAEMSEKEQVSTMLLENMQRSDLTIYEQAEGFQLMLDFGENVESISEKTGFSESTIRRRVKLLDLDKDKFKESVSRGASLEDYAKLDKIKNPELRNKVLESVGTSNFNWELKRAKDQENFEIRSKNIIEKLDTFAKCFEGTTALKYIRYISSADFEIPEDAGERKYFYTKNGTAFHLYAEYTAEEEASTEARNKERIENDNRRVQLHEIAKRAYDLRRNFIKNAWGKKNIETILKFAFVSLIKNNGGYRILTKDEFLDCCSLKIEDTENLFDNILEGNIGISPERALIVLSYCNFHDSADNNYHDYNNHHRKNSKLDIIYKYLTEMGYEFSSEEKAYKDGTHELFIKTEE